MKILVVGSGGREHALTWKIKQSPKVREIFVAPGNGGTADIANNLDIKETEIAKLLEFAKEENIDLTIVGPEVPLTLGIVDEFEKAGLKIFGPNKKAAQLEGSKAFTKSLLHKYSIPCGKSETFSDPIKAKTFIQEHYKVPYLVSQSIVLKASGLASGKGVLICQNKKEALNGINQILIEKKFGEAGDELVIEEFLDGREVSILCFVDGLEYRVMVPACDYKRIYDDDKGLNTGGMGVYSPPSFYDERLEQRIKKELIEPTLKALKEEQINYKGILYAGVILTEEGPKLLEYNCRFGDPETQVILPRLETDIIDIFLAIIEGELGNIDIQWKKESCVGVVLASGGYPVKYETGYSIEGLDNLSESFAFHAGTKKTDGKTITNGGRVLCISGLGKNLAEARETVYNEIKYLSFENFHYRRDIALRELG